MDDIEYQKQLIDTFINAIYVYDDKLVFTYNFKDGTEAIPLKAVEDAFGSDLTQVAPPSTLLRNQEGFFNVLGVQLYDLGYPDQELVNLHNIV